MITILSGDHWLFKMDTEILEFVDWYERPPIEKQFEWKTESVEYDSGIAQRNLIWTNPKRRWFINWNYMRPDKRDKVIEILNKAQGQFSSFLLRDDEDYSAIWEFSGDGTTKDFQLYKSYYDATWTEAKKDIKSGTVIVKID